jgi:PAS domain S-box-containing protein
MEKLNTPCFSNLDEDNVIRNILEGTAAHTGGQFFKALVRHLALALNTEGAWVTEYLEDSYRLQAVAFWLKDKFIKDYDYDITGTPCELVIENKKMLHIPDKVIKLFPNDPDLKSMEAVSYMGVPLFDVNNEILGHLAVLHTQPLPEEPQNLAVFRIFAARAASELQRQRAEQEIKDRENKLNLILDSALDAIIEVNSSLLITHSNTAANKIFKNQNNNINGKNFKTFLPDESKKIIRRHINELDHLPYGDQSLWIPGFFKIIIDNDFEFHVEGSLSKYERNGNSFYILILRNINERLQAKEKIISLTHEAEYLREELNKFHNFGEIIGRSQSILRTFHEIEQVAATNATVLISGETGTGKELIARAIHDRSHRNNRSLIKVNCASIPDHLMESEFFGHEKGAFTGAVAKRDGRFTLANEGTIFLDEIGELSLDLQVKLLRVLQEGEFETLGSSVTKKVDVRVIAATNRDLRKMVKEGTFREDLFYRLNVFPIKVPPLRERGNDIRLLADNFIQKYGQSLGKSISPLSDEEYIRLKNYDWPGNVRELQNVIERSVITSNDTRLNLNNALPSDVTTPSRISAQNIESTDLPIHTMKELNELERVNIIRALEKCNWKVSGSNGAAKMLDIPPSTLSSRLKALNIKRPR